MTLNLSKFRQYVEKAPWYLIYGAGCFAGIVLVVGAVLVGGAARNVLASDPTPTTLPTATASPTATALPSPTPTLLVPSPTPSPTPEPVYLIWSAHAEKVNLRDDPAGPILAAVANGTVVNPRNEVVESNGYTWVKVEVDEETGWIADFLIWEAEDEYRVLNGARACYAAREGAYKAALFKGTPYRLVATEERWMRIQLLDGEACWLPIEE